jgi:hypothetical protein
VTAVTFAVSLAALALSGYTLVTAVRRNKATFGRYFPPGGPKR